MATETILLPTHTAKDFVDDGRTLLSVPTEVPPSVKSRAAYGVHGIHYILSTHYEGALKTAVCLPNQPSEKRVRRIGAMSLKRTLGKIPIREFDEDKAWAIEFRGIQGFTTRSTTNASGNRASLSGVEALLEFDKFLGDYARQAAQDSTLYLKNPEGHRKLLERWYMVLEDLDEGFRWRVEVVDFSWDRSAARTRVANAEWTLSLVAYLAEGPKARVGVVEGSVLRGGVGVEKEHAQAVEDALLTKDILAMDSAFEKWAVNGFPKGKPWRERLAGWKPKTTADWVREHGPAGMSSTAKQKLSAVAEAMKKIDESLWRASRTLQENRRQVADAMELARKPRDWLMQSLSLINEALGALDELRSAGVAYASLPTTFGYVLNDWQHWLERMLAATVGGLGLNGLSYPAVSSAPPAQSAPATTKGPRQIPPPSVEPSGLAGPKQQPPQVGAVLVKVGQATSWEALAAKYLGTATAGKALAQFNGATSAFGKANGSPLLPEEQVLIPSPVPAAQMAKASSPDSIYGVDLYLDPQTGDIGLNIKPVTVKVVGGFSTTVPVANDLAPVGGISNFEQALRMRFMTVQGSTSLAPTYGLLVAEPGEPLTDGFLAFQTANAIDQARQDPRVLAVTSAKVKIVVDKVSLEIEAVGLTGAQVGASMPLAT